jgi:hypothetical protein
MKEAVNHPNHYNQINGAECIDIINQLKFGFCLGNALKYIWRCEEKGNKEQDLKKAIWYLNRELSNIQTDNGVVAVEAADTTQSRDVCEHYVPAEEYCVFCSPQYSGSRHYTSP